jgi:hypothetical protein
MRSVRPAQTQSRSFSGRSVWTLRVVSGAVDWRLNSVGDLQSAAPDPSALVDREPEPCRQPDL